jgi:hypothetical protein
VAVSRLYLVDNANSRDSEDVPYVLKRGDRLAIQVFRSVGRENSPGTSGFA